MSIIIDQYQDSGPLLSGRGTTTTLINNVGWMVNSAAEAMTYAEYPIIAPTAESAAIEPFAYSFTYYTFFKLSGTYVKGSRVRVVVEDATPTGVSIFCKLTDTYATPSSAFVGDMTYRSSTQTYYPRISTTGPSTNLGYLQYLNTNTTYYTEYLKTQIFVKSTASISNVVLKIKCIVDEYEEDDL